MSDSLQPHGFYSPWNSPGQNSGVGSLSLLQRIFPTQGLNLGLLLCSRLFTSWATGKPKNTRVGSLSLLQRIFPTQESNQDLLHCRWILYQLSYEGSPIRQYQVTSLCPAVNWESVASLFMQLLGWLKSIRGIVHAVVPGVSSVLHTCQPWPALFWDRA